MPELVMQVTRETGLEWSVRCLTCRDHILGDAESNYTQELGRMLPSYAANSRNAIATHANAT
jgi:hypothetical protein